MGIFSPKISKIIGKARFESLSEVINASRFAREQIDLVLNLVPGHVLRQQQQLCHPLRSPLAAFPSSPCEC